MRRRIPLLGAKRTLTNRWADQAGRVLQKAATKALAVRACLELEIAAPPEAAACRAGLEVVEKLLTTKLQSAAMTERNASMLRVTPRPVIVDEPTMGSGCSSSWSSSPQAQPEFHRDRLLRLLPLDSTR